jgi:hypothetical protein
LIRSLSLAAALGGLMMTAGVASAMPLATTAPAAPTVVQDVAWGCGPGWHPNPWGRCVPYGPVYYGGYRGYGGWGWHHPGRFGGGWHRPWYGHWHH